MYFIMNVVFRAWTESFSNRAAEFKSVYEKAFPTNGIPPSRLGVSKGTSFFGSEGSPFQVQCYLSLNQERKLYKR